MKKKQHRAAAQISFRGLNDAYFYTLLSCSNPNQYMCGKVQDEVQKGMLCFNSRGEVKSPHRSAAPQQNSHGASPLGQEHPILSHIV